MSTIVKDPGQLFLEHAYLLAGESDELKIINKSLEFLFKELGCEALAITKKVKHAECLVHSIPRDFFVIHEQQQESLLSECLNKNNNHCYNFIIEDFGYLVMIVKQPLNANLQDYLEDACRYLSKILHSSSR